MASEGDPRYPAPNEWEPYRNIEERRDSGWVRQFVNAVWPHHSARSAVRDQAMRQLTDDMRANRDMHGVVHRLEHRYEDTLMECVRLRSELAYYQERTEHAERELARQSMARPPAPIHVGRIDNFRVPTAEEQSQFNNMPIYQMGVDYARGASDTAAMFRQQQELVYIQARNEAAIFTSFGLDKALLEIDKQLSKKEPEPTGRIIDLEG